jgi:glycosyltransferase involved in cell wall biosynthesis
MTNQPRTLRIAIISKSNAPGGGASRFAESLAAWLRQEGHETVHFCAKMYGEPLPFQKPLCPGIIGRFCLFLHRVTGWLGLRELIPLEYWFFVRPLTRRFDVLHFHDHFTAYSPFTIAFASRRARVFFTAHDCVHFTGGCLYPLGCEKYARHCQQCPQRATIGQFDFTWLTQHLNKWVARNFPITYIYPSNWLLTESRRALVFYQPPVHLPNGFDAAPYDFQVQVEARRRVNLPSDRVLVCIAAHHLDDPRKGVIFALRALQAVTDLKPLVVFLGEPSPEFHQIVAGLESRIVGWVADRRELGLYLASCDLLLFSSLQDNLPIVVQEAMAASLPVVGFSTGGVGEMIQDGVSGWLMPTGDQAGLNRILREALLSTSRPERGRRARADLDRLFSKEECVRSHLALYEQLGAEKRPRSGAA